MKELRPSLHDVSCDVCARTILKGERTEAYLAPGGERKTVCELCSRRAEGEGWIRESAAADLPAESSPEPRPGFLARLWRGWAGNGGSAAPAPSGDEALPREAEAPPLEPAALELSPEPAAHVKTPRGPAAHVKTPPGPAAHVKTPPEQARLRRAVSRSRARRTGARHVRAVPTNAQVKVERALEIFNATAHPRTIAGIARSLGDPWVSAVPLAEAPSEVAVVVAWELSWYRYRVDLGDAETPVLVADKGYELDEIDETLRDWNGTATPSGHLTLGARSL